MTDTWLRSGPREACGVVGIYTHKNEQIDVARLTFFALYALQHRGQESAGIATAAGQTARHHKGMGLVSQVFNEDNLRPLYGHLAVGHNRYSTTGSSELQNAQPYLIETMHGPVAVGHNGNLTNAKTLRQRLLERGVGLISSTDSEIITQMLAAPPPWGNPAEANWEGRIRTLMDAAEGGYSLVILTQDAIYAVRDHWGLRPLCLGELRTKGGRSLGSVVVSESCALGTIDAQYLREVEPGEIVRLDASGVHSIDGRRRGCPTARCLFEYVYFSRPDSMLEGQTVHHVRQRLGEKLAEEAPADADVVIGVPDSATPAAIGYARRSGLQYTEGLTKNRYIGRTFIQPTDHLRRESVHLKYNPLRDNLEGKRVVLIDDSIVRGNTAGPLGRLLREGGGAKEVHVRISSPPVRHPCFMGVDMATHTELIGHQKSITEICEHIGADSLAYLSVGGMVEAVRAGATGQGGYCHACFSGEYPLRVDEMLNGNCNAKQMFEADGSDGLD